MSAAERIVITGLGIEAPGLGGAADLLSGQPAAPGGEFDPAQKLGRKGLLYKDRATKLALCAVKEALSLAGLPPQGQQPEASGVVVSSNLGNIDTVCRVVQTIRRGSVEDTSPLDLPNASSNVIASTIAIRFGCRALNLTLCNGATAGIDALYIAQNAIRAGRARRMLVVGVEPHTEAAQRLLLESAGADPGLAAHLGDGAACVVLESEAVAAERGAQVFGALGPYCSVPPGSTPGRSALIPGADPSAGMELWLTPDRRWPEIRLLAESVIESWAGPAPELLDLSASLGELYGALGVFQCVAACLWLSQRAAANRKGATALATAGGIRSDGLASIVIGGTV